MKNVVSKLNFIKVFFLSSLILSLSFAFVYLNDVKVTAAKGSKNLRHFTNNQNDLNPINIERSGSPWIKLKQGEPINSDFVGSDSAINQFENGSLRPTALAATDFNFDGYNDVIGGFSSVNGGILTFHRGSKEAFAPQDSQVLAGIKNGQFPVSFEKETAVIETPIAPDFIISGKFIRNSELDIVIASKNSNSIFVYSANGKGGFDVPKEIILDGNVTAISADRFDITKTFSGLIAATETNGGELVVFNGDGALDSTKSQKISIGRQVGSLILASPDGTTFDRDLFILADGQISRIPQIGKNAQNLTNIELPFRVSDFAIGEFIRDRRAKAEIAVLNENGSIYYLQNGSLDLRPFTESEMREHFAKYGRGKVAFTETTDRENSLADNWTIAEEHNLGVNSFNRTGSQPLLQKSYITGNATDDLLVVNPANGKVQVIFKEPNYEPNAASFTGETKVENVSFSNSPVAALPVRLNVMGQKGIVVLENGKLEPTPIMLAPNATFAVSKTPDTNDGACNADCSLREAVIAANTAAGADLITFTPNGVHQLTVGSFDENGGAGGDLDITQSLTITGNGTGNTVLQAGTTVNNGIDKVLSINPNFNAAFATSISGVAVQFGRNLSVGGDGYGGGFDWEGSGTGTLTVSNVNVANCRTTNGEGGGIAITNSNAGNGNTNFNTVSISNSTPGNSNVGGSSQGGGIFVGVTTHFSLNTVTISGNSVSGTNGQGGGIMAFEPSGAFGVSTITNSTVSNNTASSFGGGIRSSQVLTITTSTFSGNSGSQGGGLYNSPSSGTTTVSKSTFATNTGSNNGGGIYNNGGNLTVNFSRFNGNTGGTNNGLHVNAGTVNAENNWWSCNTGPTASPCNIAAAPGGTLDANPWLQLRINAGSTALVTGQTTNLTASFLQNSDGTAIAASNLDALIGRAVTWGGTGATITSPQNTIQAAGTATSTFSAAAIGAKTGTATVDSGTASVAINVTKANTTSVINSANLAPQAPSVSGQTFVVTYSVTAASPGGGTPTGNVTVSDGTNTCTGTVAAGQCNLLIPTAGSKTLTATYASDTNYNGSTSAGFAHTVNKASTSATITGQSNTTTPAGQSFIVNFSVTVVAPGSGTPTGNVTVSDGVESCTGTVAAGQCSLNLTTVGNRTITASYVGDGNFNANVSPGVGHTVQPVTSASASISGRVQTADGSAVSRAIVIVQAQNGSVYSATTNSFGYFRIEGLATGATYVLNVSRKGFQFNQQIISLNEDVTDLSITALE